MVSSLLKANLVSCQVLFIIQEGEWGGCCKSMRGAAQHCCFTTPADVWVRIQACSQLLSVQSLGIHLWPSAINSCKEVQFQYGFKGEIIPSGYSLDYFCQSIWPEKLGQLR